MMKRRRFTPRRLAAAALAAGLLFVLVGDRGSAATPPGIDPLEILNLQVKPNVIIALDTSGSMTETPYIVSPYGGDHQRSKLWQAKQVLKAVFQANQDKASFLFGVYRFSTPANPVANMVLRVNNTPNRFVYSAQSWAAGTFPNPACTVDPTSCPSPNPSTVTLPVEGPAPSMATTNLYLNSLYAFQWIQGSPTIQNNQIRMAENGVQCTATIAPGFYTTTTILPAIKAAMEACGPSANTYTITYAAGIFTFTRNAGSPHQFQLLWTDPATTFDGVVRQTVNQGPGTGPFSTANDARINLLARTNSTASPAMWTETFDPDGASTTLTPTLDKPSPTRVVTTYNLDAQKYWNGETVYVDASGNACDIASGTPTDPPTVTLQLTTNCANGKASADPTKKATFTWGGGKVGTGAGACQGFDAKVPLIPCSQTKPPQFDGIAPFLENQLPLDTNGTLKGYSERNDGTGTVLTNPSPGGVIASSNTPLAQTTNDVQALFSNLWNNGQAAPNPVITAIKSHPDPKEKTIFILVTDGDQNCTPFTLGMGIQAPWVGVTSGDDEAALGAAAAAQKLYNPDTTANKGNGANAGTVNADGTINGDPAASVTTYLVAYGAGASKARADWIAWGGSGMKRSFGTFSGQDTWTTIPTPAERAKCKTCVDAFLAPDPDTLKRVLESVINQGATSGEFTAQRTTTTGVFEMVGLVPGTFAGLPFSPFEPQTRYAGLVPVLFQSTFTLPLFNGQMKAFISQTNPTPPPPLVIQQQWNAGQKLTDLVNNGMTAQCPANATAGTLAGQCLFSQLHGGADDSTIGSSAAAIKRRIYTTSQNGAFTPSIDQLLQNQSPNRLTLWPPDTFVTAGTLDDALGLAGLTFAQLQTTYLACKGTVGVKLITDPTAGASSPSSDCSSSTASTALLAAQREARQRILAYTAGAQILPDGNGDPKRVQSGPNKGAVLFVTRPWVLAESTLGAPAVVSAPIPIPASDPGAPVFAVEYENYVFGPRTGTDNKGGFAAILEGFGLTFPDSANFSYKTPGKVTNASHDLLPMMTVAYVGANDMLHAFRAGGCEGTCDNGVKSYGASDTGGEELWGFVPYDQLGKLPLRMLDYPQKRDPHDYMLASGMRFSDVFVPGGASIPLPTDLQTPVQGVWRRVLFFGRGMGGKYVTALDVTGAGSFTVPALDSKGPIVLWSRGNPDTSKGVLGGTDNNTYDTNDKTAYSRMGQTWSVPAVAHVPAQFTKRKPAPVPPDSPKPTDGVQFVLFMGSGYGDTATEGTTFYTLDALTGDVVAAPDVSKFAPARTPALSYPNALVADAVDFNEAELTYGSRHPFNTKADRVYIGDLHGRLWKIRVSDLNTPIFFADLGADQPVGAPVGVFMDQTTKEKFVYVVTGNDNRVDGPFKYFAFKDDDGPTPATPIYSNFFADQRTATPPARAVNFRGTSQPLTALNKGNQGRLFFVATRFNPLGSEFAADPCRSSFDSVLYALGALSGLAAYDFYTSLGSPSDAYAILKGSRKTGVQEMAPPGSTGTGKVTMDEGLSKGPPEPPPYRGLQPSTVSGSGSKSFVGPFTPGNGVPPAASLRYVPTVCQ